MASNPERTLRAWPALVLGLALLAGGLPAAPKGFDAPTGVTLVAKDAGRFQLVWDPIYRDDLMGYSIWLRRPGEAEFTRLSVPVKVGKELRKLPMTSDASLVLALGKSKRDIEVTVVAEYQDGVSPRSASVFTHAALPAAPVPGAIPVPAPDKEPAEAAVKPADDGSVDEALRAPVRLQDKDLPLLTPQGSWRTELGLGYDFKRSIRSGTSTYGALGYTDGVSASNQAVQWVRIDVRTVFTVPLTVRWGFLPGFEAWAQGSYQAENVFIDTFQVGSSIFHHLRYFGYSNGHSYSVTEPNSAAFGDSKLGVRVQPFDRLPLLIGASATLPTGLSRFKSFLEWEEGLSDAAGTGGGAARMAFEAAYGDPGQRKGPSFHASLSPGVTERIREPWLGIPLDHVLIRGDEVEVGGDYSFPWSVNGRHGAMLLGCAVRSIGAARWTVQGIDMTKFYSPDDLGALIAHLDAKFVRDDQIELSVQVIQSVGAGLRTGGRLAYVSGVQGDAFRVSGQFYY